MRRWVELVAARDVEGLESFLDEFFSDDARLDLGAGAPEGSVRVLLDWARMAFALWDAEGIQPRYELREVIETTDGMAASIRSVTRVEGETLDASVTYVLQVRDRSITSMSLFG